MKAPALQPTPGGKLTNRWPRFTARSAAGLAITFVGFALALTTTPALAERGHVYSKTIGSGPCVVTETPSEPCEGKFDEPSGVAVNELPGEATSGDVYVIDTKNNRVEYFNKAGEYQGQFDGLEAPTGPFSLPNAAAEVSGIAIDNDPGSPSKGDVYVADVGHGVVDKFTAEGVYITQLTGFSGELELVGVGVDPEGKLWVATHNGPVFEYSNTEENEPLGSVFAGLAGTGTYLAPGFAVDSNDDLFTRDEKGVVAEFSGAGVVLNEAFDTEPVSGLATELGSDDLYADHASSLVRLSPAGIGAGAIERLALAGGDAAGVAVNSGSETLYVAQATAGNLEILVREPVGPPTVAREAVSKVTGDSAALEGEVNPRSEPNEGPTSYRFQYTTAARFDREGFVGATSLPGGEVSPDFESHVLAPVNVQGLAPGTTYYFRVLATNHCKAAEPGVVCATEGERNARGGEVVHTFTTQAAGSLVLPDGREWELVSPPDKHGAGLEPLGEEVDIQAAVGGGGIAYGADAPTESGPQGNVAGAQVLSTRTATGWSSRDLTLPHEAAAREPVGVGREYRFFSEDLSEAIVQPFGGFIACGSPQPCLSSEASEQTPYLASSYLPGSAGAPCAAGVSGCFRPLVTGAAGFANVVEGTHFSDENACAGSAPAVVFCGPEFLGATSDLSHVVMQVGTGLTVGGASGLYEWSAGKPAGEQLAFISELPEHGGPAANAVLGLAKNRNVRNAISSTGDRVFWTVGSETGGALYVRDVAKGETLRVDKGEGEFQAASSTGARVFYTENQSLYECLIEEEPVTGKLRCATSQFGTQLAEGVVAESLAAVSEDGSWVYFVSNDVLAAGGVEGQCVTGKVQLPGATCDLYVRHGGVTRLVAVLGGADFNDWGSNAPGNLARLTARVSPDGEWFAFMSGQELTGYDNHDAVSGKLDQEVYLYNAAAGQLVCASCNPSGARPVGEEGKRTAPIVGGIVGGEAWEDSSTSLAANVPAWTPYRQLKAVYQSRYLSNSGRLFFNAIDPLVPQAVNKNWDVYEYEPAGLGPEVARCGPAAVSGGEAFKPGQTVAVEGREVQEGAGCVALISSGESNQESAFLDASGMGPHGSNEEAAEDVFFLTTAKLVPADTDSALDVYDAHECSATAPCFPPAAANPPECNNEASCKPSPEAPPGIYGPPASATFSGPGNLAPPATAVKKPLTRAQKLTAALKVCKRDRKKAKRQRCEKQARKSFGPAKKAKKK